MSSTSLPSSPARRRYGRYPDNINAPARKLLALRVPAGQTLPAKATTSQWMGPIRDQSGEGSCTGQVGAELRDWLYRKLFLFEESKNVAPERFKSSASFVYKCNLIADGDLGHDSGSTIHQTLITLNQKGACLESQEPYRDRDYSIRPSEQQYQEALLYKGGSYHFLPSLAEMKCCIASGYAFAFGMDVFESFEGSQVARTGFLPMPAANEPLLGGHAQFALDYDDDVQFPDGSKGGVLVQNSWGSSWGCSAPGRTDRGCYWMPYAYFKDHAADAWMMHLGPAWK